MKKKRLNKVLNIVVTLMAAIALMLGNVTSVAAYTADTPVTGYPFTFSEMQAYLYFESSGLSDIGTLQEQNSYYFEFADTFQIYEDFNEIRIGNNQHSYIFPFQPELYDYYAVGTVAFVDNYQYDFWLKPSYGRIIYWENDILVASKRDIDTYNFESNTLHGFSFSMNLELDNNSTGGLSALSFMGFNDAICSSEMYSSISIVPVPKEGSESDTLNSILQTLTQINQNIITGNTLQQQTIDAINQNTTNTSNWFTTLITTLQGWFNTRTEDLRTWFYMIEERMSAGFTALYHQMTKEQDEKLNGYEGTSTPDANEEFNSGSSELTAIEGELSDTSTQYVNDFTATGFDSSALTAIGSSLLFVTTWFTNFWNMGGIWTAGLNICFALSIAFFVLKRR